ncbi:MAG: UDP-N-acetylglucosamine 4,6-dehydratase (inverting) [Candidatus Marinimicrobia bacterium]|nr:UDP-N-acetylglucosamine 4,6-dehydratase (inverting) [Candidatus Neomarinimicrobiota bacterium]|tara:strand:+ start:6170 stop:7192 length:1023 start_codon:yes stop_codon:yes gene_type:complete
MLNNKTILITGGTGSFGKKMLETLLKNYRCKKIIIFSRDELKQSELKEKYPILKYKNLRYFIGDIRDQSRLDVAFKNVDIVIHAAALKQVNTAEYNPIEVIKTNITGTENVVKAAANCGVKKLIALSTDKAVNPVNLYGATKLAAERLVISANNYFGYKNSTQFSVVRYGNVVGSRGSVVKVFEKLIKSDSKYLPITDLKMTRFWMTLDESVKFVTNSLSLMTGGEIFIPKIPSIKIIDLAKAMSKNKKIKIIGLRPGEKLTEVLCSEDESHLLIEFKKYFVCAPSTSIDEESRTFSPKKFSSFLVSKNGEKGKKTNKRFSYNSANNKKFLSIKEISNRA